MSSSSTIYLGLKIYLFFLPLDFLQLREPMGEASSPSIAKDVTEVSARPPAVSSRFPPGVLRAGIRLVFGARVCVCGPSVKD
jgi:hypothetical protein